VAKIVTRRSGKISSGASSASRQLMGRGSLYTLATAAPLLSGIVLLPITTRILSVEQYGVVALCLVVIQFGAILASLGLTVSITRHAILEKSGIAGARGLVLASLVAAGVVAALAGVSGPLWRFSSRLQPAGRF
jgi:O-antigen/teichoic acid export membrane protein